MPSGTVGSLPDLPEEARRVVHDSRRAVLTTVAHDGAPKSVPAVFAIVGDELVTPIDAKPKEANVPGRVRNVMRDPRATLLFDRWDENWQRLSWVRVEGAARIEEVGTASDSLVARYPQYRSVSVGNDAIWITPRRIVWWSWT